MYAVAGEAPLERLRFSEGRDFEPEHRGTHVGSLGTLRRGVGTEFESPLLQRHSSQR